VTGFFLDRIEVRALQSRRCSSRGEPCEKQSIQFKENIMPTTLEVGKKLVELCQQGKSDEAMNTLYAKDVVSVEAGAPPGKSATTTGLDGVKGKAEWWYNNHEIHSMKTTGPWPHGDRFIANFTIDVTPKAGPMAGKRFVLEEAALYTVKDGKIVREEFFYSMGG
jgi:ketosteroid isomerase-like protein